MKATEVFTPGKLPEVTYIDDHLKEHSRVLRDTLETGAAVISLSGPSKSGKTVFIEKNVGKDRLIQVTGAGISDSARSGIEYSILLEPRPLSVCLLEETSRSEGQVRPAVA